MTVKINEKMLLNLNVPIYYNNIYTLMFEYSNKFYIIIP